MAKFIVVLTSVVLFCGALGGFLWWYLGNQKDAAQKASDQMAAALEDNKSSEAPKGGDDYVSGMRQYFGPIRKAKTVDVRQVESHSNSATSNDDDSWWTSTIFLRSERGAALVLVTFEDTLDPHDANIDNIRELNPRKVAKGALTPAELKDAKRAFKARGGKTATALVLDGTFPEDGRRAGGSAGTGGSAPVPSRPSRKKRNRQLEDGERRLRCVQHAHGDIDKLKKCADL